jgi:hypothetical protein
VDSSTANLSITEAHTFCFWLGWLAVVERYSAWNCRYVDFVVPRTLTSLGGIQRGYDRVWRTGTCDLAAGNLLVSNGRFEGLGETRDVIETALRPHLNEVGRMTINTGTVTAFTYHVRLNESHGRIIRAGKMIGESELKRLPAIEAQDVENQYA